jgi:integrase
MESALLSWFEVMPESPHGLVWPPARWATTNIRSRRCRMGGVDPEVIKAILGHSSIVTSRGYQHVSQTMARKAMEGLAERLQQVSGTD